MMLIYDSRYIRWEYNYYDSMLYIETAPWKAALAAELSVFNNNKW